jgi:hypothetical protein
MAAAHFQRIRNDWNLLATELPQALDGIFDLGDRT